MLTWTRLRMPLPVGKTEVKDGSLTIRNLSPADSGLYECVATNSMGTKKATMNVVVQQQPKGLWAFLAPTLSSVLSLNYLRYGYGRTAKL